MLLSIPFCSIHGKQLYFLTDVSDDPVQFLQTSKTNSWLSKEKGVGKNELGINIHTAVAAKSLQSCPALRDPIDGSPAGPAVPGIL